MYETTVSTRKSSLYNPFQTPIPSPNEIESLRMNVINTILTTLRKRRKDIKRKKEEKRSNNQNCKARS
jgi:hypothetical protein